MKQSKPINILSQLIFFSVIACGCKSEQPKTAPVVLTSAITGITPNSMSCGGSITSDGGAPVTEKGVCFSLNLNPTISDQKTSDGKGTEAYASSVTGLTPGETYYVKAYATNKVGTSYGDQMSGTTLAILGTILTSEVTSIMTTSASCGGNITYDGGSTITARGVCWSTKENPSLNDNTTTDGSGKGPFTSSITGLTPGVTYYLRAYSTNSAGTVYGNQVSFYTKEDPLQVQISPSVSDTLDINTANVRFTITTSSMIPSAGLIHSAQVLRLNDNKSIFKIDTLSLSSIVQLNLGKFEIGRSYKISFDIRSKTTSENNSLMIQYARWEKTNNKYLKTSYELSNYDEWISSDEIFRSPTELERGEILIFSENCQLDYDGDGHEDIYSADPDSIMNIYHPQILYKNIGGKYMRQSTKLPWVTGNKVLVGDFNNDFRPDIFSLSAVDLPNGMPGLFPNNLLINDGNGNFIKTEFSGKGLWYSGASGDIDNDGDLDIVIFNYHVVYSGEKNRIYWNDGKGYFTVDYQGVGDITDQFDHCELIDMDNDGYLDLVVNKPEMPAGYGKNTVIILWGNGSGFSYSNRTLIPISNPYPMCDMDVIDVDGDKTPEIIFAVTPNEGGWEVNMYKSTDNARTFSDVTSRYIPESKIRAGDYPRMTNLRVQDIEKNGRMDIFSTDRKANIHWEQDAAGVFIRK